MKKLSLLKIAAIAALAFTSCEKDNLDSPESIEPQEITVNRSPLSAKFKVDVSKITRTGNLPQSIQELRDEGIRVSGGLADYVRNSLETLLRAAELSITNPDNLREFGFFESEIIELIEINRRYNDLVTLLNLDFSSFTSVPTTLTEARAAGIPISTSLEVLGDLQTILTRSLVLTGFNDPLRSLTSSDRTEVRRLRRVFIAIQEAVDGTGDGGGTDGGDGTDEGDGTGDGDGTDGGDSTIELNEASLAFIARFNFPQTVVNQIAERNAPFFGGADAPFERLREYEAIVVNFASTATFLGNGVYRVQTTNSQGTQTFFVERTIEQLRGNFQGILFARTGLNPGDRSPALDEVLARIADEYTQTFINSVS
ncbi:hypothetical protein [Aquimarina aggregata]|uniref:hypothetical protein n=1 Tax=Aquimarina aggregata TaxID=1642818 RepID=UPI00248F6D00|nr:hypothetical protein [Aquimarina aggregata]